MLAGGRPFPLKLWLQVTYPLLKAASLDTFCLLPYFVTWCDPSVNLYCRSETCCTRLAGNAGPKKVAKKSPSGHHRSTTLLGYIFATKAHVDNRKKPVKQRYVLHMSS